MFYMNNSVGIGFVRQMTDWNTGYGDTVTAVKLLITLPSIQKRNMIYKIRG